MEKVYNEEQLNDQVTNMGYPLSVAPDGYIPKELEKAQKSLTAAGFMFTLTEIDKLQEIFNDI